jgi:hypothetical protein
MYLAPHGRCGAGVDPPLTSGPAEVPATCHRVLTDALRARRPGLELVDL